VSDERGYDRVAVAGSGVVATGLAASATLAGAIVVLARSEKSAKRAVQQAGAACEQIKGGDLRRVRTTTDAGDLAGCDLVVEAIVEEPEAKVAMISELVRVCPDADLATTTSSLSVAELGASSGSSDRLFGLHVFNPVARMELVEVCFPEAIREGVRDRAKAWCEAIGKTPVEVPDQAGFVVNRLLFPYLFDAVRMVERTGMKPADVDTCMQLGTGHPMGPLALLDLVGIDVAVAIGEALHDETGDAAHLPPGRLIEMVGAGRLGKKSGSGFFDYDQ
jgi:3-hydroxybutyryl-CoA dehydrogenase